MRFPTNTGNVNLHNLCSRIKELSSNSKWKDVLSHYREIKKVGFELGDHTIFSHVLKASLSLSFRHGKAIHASMIKQGFESFSSVGNSLIDFYVKSGQLGLAVHTFNCIKTRDSVSWNIIINGQLNQGASEQGLDLFNRARAFGFEPNVSTLVLLIQTYRSVRAFVDGQKFHGYLIHSGLCSLLSVQNSLLCMYTDIRLDYAENLFDEILEKDVITWSTMIGGYVHSDEILLALELFKRMVSGTKIEADGQTMVSILKACAKLADIKMGKSVHGYVVTRGLNYDLFVGNTLVDFYCRCGEIDSAVVAFNDMPHKNIVSWNSLLSGYVQNEKHTKGLVLFASMGKLEVVADEVTIVNLLLICKALGDLHRCKSIHSRILRRGFENNDMVINSLMDAYAKCNQIEFSWRLFCRIHADDIAWSTMMSGFTHCGMPNEATALYWEMQLSKHNQNPIVILNLLEACSLSAEIARSKWAHGIAVRMGLASDVVVGTAILDMYSKCGAIEMSRKAFEQISMKNIVSWGAIIAAYGLNSHPHDALSLFNEMKTHGLKPNSVTALSVLSACCHGGLVNEGISFFKDLANNHGDILKLEHYSCLVDMLARAGDLDDTLELIKSSPLGMKLGASAWGAVLSACRNYENRKLTTGALSQILELEPSNSAGYLLASNVYANRGSWMDAQSALEKSKYEQSLESARRFIAITENELELYYRHVALYGDPNNRDPKSILDCPSTGGLPNNLEPTSNTFPVASASSLESSARETSGSFFHHEFSETSSDLDSDDHGMVSDSEVFLCESTDASLSMLQDTTTQSLQSDKR